jgi:TRAP-type C4-dicarboxylate transport system substrate-binding protein
MSSHPNTREPSEEGIRQAEPGPFRKRAERSLPLVRPWFGAIHGSGTMEPPPPSTPGKRIASVTPPLQPGPSTGPGTWRSLSAQHQIIGRLLLIAGLITAFAMAWRHYAAIPLLVIGQPRSVGLLQRDQEEPFFRNLADTTGLPLKITYVTTDAFGLKDTHQLDALRDGRIDIVSLRFMQNIAKEPSLEGIDLPGRIPDFSKARQVVRAYSPTVDRYLKRAFGAKLLGIWSFGPQVMVCRHAIGSLSDMRGRKVRVASPGLAQLITAVGGIPAILSFEDTQAALAQGIVDCAVTSAASASYAGWTRYSRYYYPMAFQFGFNGYAMSLKRWSSLSADEQQRLAAAFQAFSEKLWTYSENLERESEACITGEHCRILPSQRLTRVQPSPYDVQLLQELSRQVVLPQWSARCEQQHPGCRREWDEKVAPITDPPGDETRRP